MRVWHAGERLRVVELTGLTRLRTLASTTGQPQVKGQGHILSLSLSLSLSFPLFVNKLDVEYEPVISTLCTMTGNHLFYSYPGKWKLNALGGNGQWFYTILSSICQEKKEDTCHLFVSVCPGLCSEITQKTPIS